MIIFLNGEQREVAEDATLRDVIVEHGDLEPRRGIAVAVDGSVVPRARLADTALNEGAKVEIVTAVQGG
ncbi:putative thiamine biosynthesis protein ThiS [Microlunatus phosphovorus NM-1]|uniref:Putative thiamine biosynthesis protein ThiS n=1 Tax=Microlunatus phosphovorus (strain ATCC 700054 / DSM 10555 / JCM 9379 / NBRC 101784 / NCIMB 13414 / VKM Ac-1990 / NM-1) TaxID=1032480 RepID=F5XRV5_MICPN|nr:sulfur carrier protein ThiS [Microlunatus phosphovorus]BAK37168.1 putative thiamine biosynthesis protein ThiS [Microlunatus phosphovorus NM-1]